MKLPLLLEGKPVLNATGPLVYLLPGLWKLQHNVTSSEIDIMLNASLIDFVPLSEYLFAGDQTIQIQFRKVGSENSITIYAVKQE